MTTAYAFVPSPEHAYGDHPESPGRLALVPPELLRSGAVELEATPATRGEIGWVHHPDMIAWVEQAAATGEAIIDLAPTYVTRSSFRDALSAAGATLACTRAVMADEATNAFAIVRPPGHHAEPNHSMGFCLFNNVAIAAQGALRLGAKRVAVVDFDAHHGNGTQAAFLAETDAAYISMHQWGIYPGTGWFDEASQAKKRIVNIPLPAGAGDRAYARIGEEIVEPFIREWSPGLILVSAGFDAHWNDPITSLGLTSAGFYRLSKRLVDLADEVSAGRIVFVLEGGYDPANVANGVEAVFAALMAKAPVAMADASPRHEPDVSVRLDEIKAWHGFGR